MFGSSCNYQLLYMPEMFPLGNEHYGTLLYHYQTWVYIH